MLRKYYNCNNSVTNVESGSKSAIVKSGGQIRHHRIWRSARRASTSHLSGRALNIINAQASWKKLEAGSKLEKKGMNKMNKLNKAATITNVIIVIIMVLLTHACYLKGKHTGADEIMSHIYPMSGIVTEVNHQEDRVVVTDSTGNEWEFDGAEDWHTGDIAAMIMEDNGTEEIYDDEIIDVQYDG